MTKVDKNGYSLFSIMTWNVVHHYFPNTVRRDLYVWQVLQQSITYTLIVQQMRQKYI